MKSVIGIVLLVGGVYGVYALNAATRTEDGKSILNVAGELPITVEVSTPEQRSIIRAVQAPGDVEALSEVDISAEVVAKILEMPVEEGDLVKKGDLLCRLDDADYQARITSAAANVEKLKAMIRQAEADDEKAERDYRRQLDLVESNATSSKELADYRTAHKRSRAMVDVRRQELIEAEAMLEAARDDLTKTVITSPIDGIVSQHFAKEGEVVITGTMNNPGTRIMVISDLSEMQIRCRVDETDAPLVLADQPARIYLQSESQAFTAGHVLRVATKGTKATGRDVVTFETLVLVDSLDGRIKPGMTANVEIEVARSDEALTVPVEAVVYRKRKDLPEELVKQYDEANESRDENRSRRAAAYLKVVYRVQGEDAKPSLVEIGISDETGVEIVSGVLSDDKVVVGPFRSLDQLAERSKIKIDEGKKKEGEAEEPAGATDEPQADGGEAHASAESGS